MTVAVDDGHLGLHMAARSVLERCPEPANALEVAIVLETCGYTESRARLLGAGSLLDLGEAVLALLPIYATRRQPVEPPSALEDGSGVRPWTAFARGLLSSAPWLVGMATTLVAGASFWTSAVAIQSIAVSVSLASTVGLIVVAPFIQAFGRRASFYGGLGDQGMVVRVHRWTLEAGLVATVLVAGGVYLVRQVVLGVGTPASNRLGLAATLAIGGLQVGLASFYLRRAFLAMAAIVVGGSVALVWHTLHAGAYLDPVRLAVWQIRLVAVMAAVAWVAGVWWLLRVPDRRHGPMWRPAGAALLRAVAPYAAYGLAFFCVVCLPQVVSGGAWQGRFRFNAAFALADGVALLVLVPMLAQTMALVESVDTTMFPEALARYRTGELLSFRQAMHRAWRRQLLVVAALGAATCAVIDLLGPVLGSRLGPLDALDAHEALLVIATVAIWMFGMGTFAAQVLVALSAPGPAVRAAWLSVAVLVTVSGIASLVSGPSGSAAWSLVAASAAFAFVAVRAADRAFRHADLTFYRTM